MASSEDEDTFTAQMDKRWGFMLPWCEVLKPHIGVWNSEEAEEYIWVKKDVVLKVKLPRRIKHTDETTFRQKIQNIQEALALLVAVHHADEDAYDFLVVDRCGLKNEALLFQAPISTKFLLQLDLKGHEMDGTIEYDLALFCGTNILLHPSEEYLSTLKKIAAVDENLKRKEGGVEIEIPVKVVSQFKHGELLQDAVKAEKEIDTQWKTYRESTKKKDLLTRELRCSFVLEPMRADLSMLELTTEKMEAIEQQIADSVWFSSINLDFHIGAENDLAVRKPFGLLCRRLFDSCRRNHNSAHINYKFQCAQDPNPSQIQVISVFCDMTMPARDFRAMCSAMVFTQTTKKLSLDLDILDSDSINETNREHRWKWLAYALFSKRARASSSVENLIIACLGRMNERDARSFASVIKSEHPEEMLFGTPRGLVDERDATLRSGAPIRWQFDDQGQLVEGSNHLVFDYPVPFVRTFSDDGESEWVNVLVPGFERCQVERGNLEFRTEKAVSSGGIRSLTLDVHAKNMTRMEGILPFIESIGPSLSTLTIKGASIAWGEGPDVNAIIRSCPNLQELTISRSLIDVQLDLSEYRSANESVPELVFEWTDVTKFAKLLCDPNSPLTKCTKRLNVSLLTRVVLLDDLQAGRAPPFEFYVNALVDMLKVNERLEFLEVRSPYLGYVGDLRKFDFKPIHRQRKSLSSKCRAAFLSLNPSRKETTEPLKKMKKSVKGVHRRSAIEDIDRHVIANIFSFAALPVRRRVYYNCNKVLENRNLALANQNLQQQQT